MYTKADHAWCMAALHLLECLRSGELVGLMQACAWAIDELKATVPIWKKEVYEGGEVWKENAEARQAMLNAQ